MTTLVCTQVVPHIQLLRPGQSNWNELQIVFHSGDILLWAEVGLDAPLSDTHSLES